MRDTAGIKKSAALLVTDIGYLVPSLVVVRQLRAFGITENSDILVYLIDIHEEIASKVAADFAHPAVQFIEFSDRSFLPASMDDFYRNQVTTTTLARLVLGPHIPTQYEHLVYIDGDVQIWRDPSALFTCSVQDGMICAGRDGAWLEALDGTPLYDNIEALELDPESYFNAGVLAFSRRTWIEKGPQALDVFLANPKLCRAHDQSALNVVFRGQLAEMSPIYNFHNLYAEAGAMRFIDPAIVHFTGKNKPWSGFPPPWFWRLRKSYQAMVAEFPYLSSLITTKPELTKRSLKVFAKAAKRQVGSEGRRMARRRAAIRGLMAENPFFIA